MRRIAGVLLILATAVGLTGCPGPPKGPGGGPAPGAGPPKFTPTADIYTAPAKGRYTLRLIWHVEEDPSAKESVARLQAEAVAKALRQEGLPAFILKRSLGQGGAASARETPVYYVCLGAFDGYRTEEAQAARDFARQIRMAVGAEQKQPFAQAQFVILQAPSASDVDALLSLYEVPRGANYGLVLGLFEGPRHKELAREYALSLRQRDLKPLIQETEQASRVVVGASAREDEPLFRRLLQRYSRVQTNLLGYIVFRGVHQGRDHAQRARVVERDLADRGYDAFVEYVLVKTGAAKAATVPEAHVFVVRKESGNFTLAELRRTYADEQPHDVRAAEYHPTVVDLRKGAWSMRVKQPGLTPG